MNEEAQAGNDGKTFLTLTPSPPPAPGTTKQTNKQNKTKNLTQVIPKSCHALGRDATLLFS